MRETVTPRKFRLIRITATDHSGPNVDRVSVEETGNLVTKITHLKDGRSITWSHRLNCFPDTIDPRGPKGH